MSEKTGADYAASNAEYMALFERLKDTPPLSIQPVLQLYAWQPRGQGEESFFVCASSEEAARAAIEADFSRRMAISEYNDENFERMTEWPSGWGTDYYRLTVAAPGVVVANDNQ